MKKNLRNTAVGQTGTFVSLLATVVFPSKDSASLTVNLSDGECHKREKFMRLRTVCVLLLRPERGEWGNLELEVFRGHIISYNEPGLRSLCGREIGRNKRLFLFPKIFRPAVGPN